MSEEKESEKLIDELESIYLQDGWRNDTKKAERVKQIKARLSEILCPKED